MIEKKPQSPKVFISHASEDKDSFVREFAAGLRRKGVDAWFDEWEMDPGDSLIEKIFDEGIGQSSAVVVVVSQFSVDKPWVREELSVAKVRQINQQVKLIPIVIDDTPVPVSLENLVRLRAGGARSIDQIVHDTSRAIFGISQRPELGSPPAFTKTDSFSINGLRSEDVAVLRVICTASLNNGHPYQSANEIFDDLQAEDISIESAQEVIEILEIKHLVEVAAPISSNRRNDLIKPTLRGLQLYLKASRATYDQEINHAAALLVNGPPANLADLARELNISEPVAEFYLEVFADNDLVRCSRFMEGTRRIDWVSPKLRRMLEDQ